MLFISLNYRHQQICVLDLIWPLKEYCNYNQLIQNEGLKVTV